MDTLNSASSRRKTIVLREPIDFDGRHLTSVTLRPLRVRDMVAAQRQGGDEMDMSLNLMSACMDLPREAIDELSIADFEILMPEVDAISGKHPAPDGKS